MLHPVDSDPIPPRPLFDVIAEAIRGLRDEAGYSQENLAAAMRSYGFNWTKTTVGEIEGPRRRRVSIEELFGLSMIFDTKVAHFMLSVPSVNRPLIEMSSVLRLPQSEMLELIGRNIRVAPSRQEEASGPIADLVRLRRDRSRAAVVLENATQRVDQLRQEHAMHEHELFKLSQEFEKLSAQVESAEQQVLQDRSDPFAIMLEQLVAERLEVDVVEVMDVAASLWNSNARDEVNRRATAVHDLEPSDFPVAIEGAEESVTVFDDSQYMEITGGVLVELERHTRRRMESILRAREHFNLTNDALSGTNYVANPKAIAAAQRLWGHSPAQELADRSNTPLDLVILPDPEAFDDIEAELQQELEDEQAREETEARERDVATHVRKIKEQLGKDFGPSIDETAEELWGKSLAWELDERVAAGRPTESLYEDLRAEIQQALDGREAPQ